MEIRLYEPGDAAAVAAISASCVRSEADFVLNPMWETEAEFHAEFARHRIRPEETLLVAEGGDGRVHGLSGFLSPYIESAAGMFCPVVERSERGHGLGGALLRAALEFGQEKLGVRLATAGVGTRNRAGYSLLTAHGFRPVRQEFLMRCSQLAESDTAQDLDFDEPGEDDLPALRKLYERCGFEPRKKKDWTRAREDGRHAWAVARAGKRVVAFVELETHWPVRPWVAYVGVEDDERDRGVGSTLLRWALERQFEAGAESAMLVLSPANRTAMRAYEKVGFKRTRQFDVLEKSV